MGGRGLRGRKGARVQGPLIGARTRRNRVDGGATSLHCDSLGRPAVVLEAIGVEIQSGDAIGAPRLGKLAAGIVRKVIALVRDRAGAIVVSACSEDAALDLCGGGDAIDGAASRRRFVTRKGAVGNGHRSLSEDGATVARSTGTRRTGVVARKRAVGDGHRVRGCTQTGNGAAIALAENGLASDATACLACSASSFVG